MSTRKNGAPLSPGLELAGQASEQFLAARWNMARGDTQRAGRSFWAAANLWREAARNLESESPTESIRQLINRVVCLAESGAVGHADAAREEVSRRIASDLIPNGARAAMLREWGEIVDLAVTPRMDRWFGDQAALRRELNGSHGSLDLGNLSCKTVDHWVRSYPCLANAHWIAFRVAERQADHHKARRHLEEAMFYDPEDSTFRALYMNVLVDTEPPGSAAQLVERVFVDRPRQSAMVAYVYAISLIALAHRGGLNLTKAIETSEGQLKFASTVEPNDMPLSGWGYAHVLHQYCLWKLGRAGVQSPFRKHVFQRGGDIFIIDWSGLATNGASHISKQAEIRLLREAREPAFKRELVPA